METTTVVMGAAGTEFVLKMPARTYGYTVQNLSGADIRVASAASVVTDDSGDWERIAPGASKDFGQVELTDALLYLACPNMSGARARIHTRT